MAENHCFSHISLHSYLLRIGGNMQSFAYSPLGGAFFAGYERPLNHDAAFEKASNECENTGIRNPPRHLLQEMFVRDFIEAGAYISFDHPSVSCSGSTEFVEWLDTVHGAASRSKAVGEVVKVCFPNRLQHHFEQHLNRSVFHGGNAERPFLARSWLWYLNPSHW